MTTSTESRLLQYIADHGLHDGQPLPPAEELKKILGCDDEELAATLADMESRGLVQRHDWGWSVLSQARFDGKDNFSLSKSALLNGHRLDTKVIEKAIRLPSDEEGFLSDLENRAQAALGLAKDEPLIVLTRLRRLSDSPADAPSIALHRAYLRPDLFPKDFLDKHDFEQESLAHIYRHYGYKTTTRDTTLHARAPNLYERNDLKKEYDIPTYHPVLHAEQWLYAETPAGQRIVLEYLQASYVNWTYEIKQRPA